MLVNPFEGKRERPTDEELSIALGSTKAVWDRFIADLGEAGAVNIQEWAPTSSSDEWALLLKQKDRTVAYLYPVHRCFQVGFVLDDKTLRAVRQGRVSQELLRVVEAASRRRRGSATFRIDVKGFTDLAPIMKLATIKVEN